METLKPCPFCGSDDIRISVQCRADDIPGEIAYGWAVCEECEAEGPPTDINASEGGVIRAWNRRS